jgi:hypothetical protein
MDDLAHDSSRAPRIPAASAVLLATIALSGCIAAPPGGADFAEVVLAAPPSDKALVVVFRNHADPTGLAARILIDGSEMMRLPEESFGLAVVDPGQPTLELVWPPLSGTPGWDGTGDWAAGATYYYELTGTAGHGFYFRSQLIPTDPRLATLKMQACCWLITAQKDHELVRAGAPPAPPPRAGAVSFEGVKEGMLQKEVIDALGLPDEVSSDYTGSGRNPFSFSADTFREYWVYSGTGYIAFSLNQYTNTSRVVQALADGSAKSKPKERPAPPTKATPIRR